jgi:hypothetical protein
MAVFFSIEVKFARNAKSRARNQFEANVWGNRNSAEEYALLGALARLPFGLGRN